MSCTRPCYKDYIYWYRNELLTVLTPIIFLPIPLIIPTQSAWCGWVVLVISVYWCTLCIPIYITGIVPLFIFPMLGILDAEEVALSYMTDSLLVATGAVIAALSVERVNLHYRIALGVLDKISFSSQWLMIGLCLPAWFLSMFIMNTAVLAMMLVIMISLLDKMEEVITRLGMPDDGRVGGDDDDCAVEMTFLDSNLGSANGGPVDYLQKRRYSETNTDEKRWGLDPPPGKNNVEISGEKTKRPQVVETLGVSFSLGIGYAAKIGGLATLTGSSNNLIAVDYINKYYAAKGLTSPINYTNWLALCLPMCTLCVIANQLWLQFQYEGCESFRTCFKKTEMTQVQKEAKEFIRKQYESLGSIKYEEIVVIMLFGLLVFLWFFRDPGFLPGWGSLFPEGYLSDTAPAMVIVFIMFFFPLKPMWRKANPGTSKTATLLNWPFVRDRFPWGAYFMCGAGAAIGSACLESGLNAWIQSILDWLEYIPMTMLVFLTFFMLSLFTECLSVGTINGVFSWILGDIAVKMGYSPLMLMLPTAISASMAFMIPSCGTDSAMVYECGRMPVKEMVKAGFIVKCLSCPLATLAVCTWGVPIFDLYTVPWDTSVNATTETAITNSFLGQGLDTLSSFEL